MVLGTSCKHPVLLFKYRAVTFFGWPFNTIFLKRTFLSRALHTRRINPSSRSPQHMQVITWRSFFAVPVSLTTTQGITFVFFSWPYLDVSVQAVRFHTLYIQAWILDLQSSGFPHSEIFGSMLDWQLPEAYSSLPLPSSPLDAKASTNCSFQLSTKVLKRFNNVLICIFPRTLI